MKIKILSVDEQAHSMLVAFYPDDVAINADGSPEWSLNLNYNIPIDQNGEPLVGEALMGWLAEHRPVAEVAAEARRRSGSEISLAGVRAMIGTESVIDDSEPSTATGDVAGISGVPIL